eukprot:4639407-Amphidinium_carterae.1
MVPPNGIQKMACSTIRTSMEGLIPCRGNIEFQIRRCLSTMRWCTTSHTRKTLRRHLTNGKQRLSKETTTFNQPAKYEVNDSTSGVETAFARCQSFLLHDPIDVVDDWTLFRAFVEDSVERLAIWNRPRKT